MKSLPRFGRGSARVLPTHLDQGLEIIFLEKGALNWHAEGRVERVTAGSVYFSLPWEQHGSVDEFEPGHYWHWVQIGIEGGLRRPRREFRFHRDIGIPPAEARAISAMLTRTGRRRMFALILVLLGIGHLLLGYADALLLPILAGSGLIGIATAFSQPALAGYIIDALPAHMRGRAMASVIGGLRVGQFINPFVLAPAIGACGMGATFLGLGLLNLLVGVVVAMGPARRRDTLAPGEST